MNSLRDEAMATFEALGATPWLERARELDDPERAGRAGLALTQAGGAGGFESRSR